MAPMVRHFRFWLIIIMIIIMVIFMAYAFYPFYDSLQGMARLLRLWLNIGNHIDGRELPIQPIITTFITDMSSVSQLTSVPCRFKKIIHDIGKHSRDRNAVDRERVFVYSNNLFWCVSFCMEASDCTSFPDENVILNIALYVYIELVNEKRMTVDINTGPVIVHV